MDGDIVENSLNVGISFLPFTETKIGTGKFLLRSRGVDVYSSKAGSVYAFRVASNGSIHVPG